MRFEEKERIVTKYCSLFRYEAQKAKFLVEGKVDKYGAVRELLLFHGTTSESVNLIAEHNFTLDQQPLEAGQCCA